MEAKKVNLFAFLMVVVMCAVSIYVCIGKKDNTTNYSNDILAIYKKLDDIDDEFDEVDEKITKSQGKSAYELAQDNGFTGTVNEWLDSLNGSDGQDAELDIPLDQIYNAYLTATGKTETEYPYDDFLLEIASGKYDKKIASQKAYSTTVDICYSYTTTEWTISNDNVTMSTGTTESVYQIDEQTTQKYLAAGAGVIYQMFDSNTEDEYTYDTAYIITNYHVVYAENYSNDPNYIIYNNTSTGKSFLGTICDDDDIFDVTHYYDLGLYGTTYTTEDFRPSSITTLSINDGLQKHFLNGRDGEYYGIYLFGYQDMDYKLKATFVGGSADNDIAILKIERTNQESNEVANILFETGYYKPATIGDSTALVGGEEVIAVGNPLMTTASTEQAWVDSLVFSTTEGTVSSVSNKITMQSIIGSSEGFTIRVIRISNAINAGNSGGGLYDLFGNLVGIVNAKSVKDGYDNIGYAIPVNVAVAIADQVIYQCDGLTKSSLNTRIKTLTTENLGFDTKKGISNSRITTDSSGNVVWKVSYNVVVESVTEGSLAYAGGNGLKADDIIKQVSFAGVDYSASEFFNMVYELDDLLLKVKLNCTQISFKVSRDGSEQTITINLNDTCFTEIV